MEFRILTIKLDQVEPEIKKPTHEVLKQADIFVDVGTAYDYKSL